MSLPANFKPMRSASYSPKHIEGAYIASYKLDGIRGCIGTDFVRSKSLKKLANLQLHEQFACPELENLDGEFIVGCPTDPEAYNRTLTQTSTIRGEFTADFYVFDDFSDPTLKALERRISARERVSNLPDHLRSRVKLAPYRLINAQEAEGFYSEALSLGYEGAVYTNIGCSYKFGKATEAQNLQFKRKPEDDHDAQVLDVEPAYENQNAAFTNELGNTARSTHQENLVAKPMVGRFRVRDCLTGQEFWCGPGKMTHAEREAVWKQFCMARMTVVGRFIKYRSMTYGTVELPRHPRWYAWRDEADTETLASYVRS